MATQEVQSKYEKRADIDQSVGSDRMAQTRFSQPTAAYSAKMLFGEVNDVQMGDVSKLISNIVIVGVIVIIVLGLMVWNNWSGMRIRVLFTLLLVVILVVMMVYLREKVRSAFLSVKDAGNRMVDGFAHLNMMDNITYDMELDRRSRSVQNLNTAIQSMRLPPPGAGMMM